MQRLLYWLAVLGLCGQAATAVAVTSLSADLVAAGTGLPLGGHVELLEDPSGALDLPAVSSGAAAARFVPAPAARPNLGYTRSAYWVRFTVDPGASAHELLLEVAVPTLDSLRLYLPGAPDGAVPQVSGDSLPWSARSQAYRNHVFRLPLRAGTPQPVYLRVQTSSLLILPMTLWRADDYRAFDRRVAIGLGLFYGLVCGLFLYNLMLYLSLRDGVYLLYVAYLAAFGLALAALDGTAFAYLWPDSPWWANQALATLLSLAHCVGVLFTREFLLARQPMPRWRRFCDAYAAAFAVLTLCGATGWGLDQGRILQVMSFASPTGAMLVLAIAVSLIRQGYRPARFFLLAWSALLVSMILASLRNFGIGPDNVVTTWGLHFGLALDVVLLSTALADRIRMFQDEVLAAQRRLIDASRHYQQVLERRAEDLAAANRELESYSHTVAHDLRAPLRAIDGFSSLVREGLGADVSPAVRADLDRIGQNARRMATLVDALLEFSRLGRRPLGDETVDLGALAQAALADTAPELRARVHLGPLPVVRGDAALLRQVLANLLDNALKFSRDRADARVDVGAEENSGEWIVHVSDNGAGFDMDYADKLFGMFQRLHGSAEFEGTGVGLATVQRIVLRHGGRVWAAGRPGGGARFSFSLPKPAADAGTPGSA